MGHRPGGAVCRLQAPMDREPARHEPSRRATRLTLAAILIAAALLRVSALDKPLYVDEMTTITVASQPLDAMPRVMRLIDASPALFPLMLHGWLTFGRADAWVRLLPAIFGFLAVVVVWKGVSHMFGTRAGLAAAAVMAISPGHVQYAQYVRNYSLFALLAWLHIWLAVGWARGSGRRPIHAVALVVVTTALLYTHYLSLLLIGTTGLFMMWRARPFLRSALGWGAIVAVSGLLFLPGVPLLGHNVEFDRIRNADRPEPPPLRDLVPTLVAELGVGQRSLGFGNPSVRRLTLAAALVLLPALAVLGFVRERRVAPEAAWLMAMIALVPLAIYVGSGRRLVAVRFFLPFMTAYIALIGAGLASLGGRAAAMAGIGVLALSTPPLTHFITRYSWSYDHRAVAAAIGAASRSDDALLFVHPFETFYYQWYLGDRMRMEGLLFTPLVEQDTYVIKPPPLDLDRAADRISRIARSHRRFWIVGQTPRSFASDDTREEALLRWLDARYDRIASLDHLTGGEPRILLYGVRQSDPPAVSR
jgi:uncharacterized membrane protein